MPQTSLPENEAPRTGPAPQRIRRKRREIDPAAGEQLVVGMIADLSAQRRDLDDRLRAAARAAADAGVTWERLGRALGMTRGGAWHYAHPDTADEQAG